MATTILTEEIFRKNAVDFLKNPPYKEKPFDGRNWGHPWHSLCSYHGKLKPAIAHFLVSNFTNEGDVVLDPMSGVGTIPFEASLQGRIGIGNDLSELAYIVTKAKLDRPNKDNVDSILKELELFIKFFEESYSQEDVPYKDFGLNKKIPDYFHPQTYSEILAARMFFINKIPELSTDEAFVFSCFFHVLHGNRPYALSRNSHPLTPYAPTGEFVYKNVIKHIKNKVELSYKKGEFNNFVEGEAILGDMFDLGEKYESKIDSIITSPPFVGSIKFYNQNWLRLWLSGWEPSDFIKAESRFLEGKQDKDLSIYTSFFDMCFKVLKPRGTVILHLGKSKKCDMGTEIQRYAKPYFNVVYFGNEDVSNIEKHGISDKGSTTSHQFLFLQKK